MGQSRVASRRRSAARSWSARRRVPQVVDWQPGGRRNRLGRGQWPRHGGKPVIGPLPGGCDKIRAQRRPVVYSVNRRATGPMRPPSRTYVYAACSHPAQVERCDRGNRAHIDSRKEARGSGGEVREDSAVSTPLAAQPILTRRHGHRQLGARNRSGRRLPGPGLRRAARWSAADRTAPRSERDLADPVPVARPGGHRCGARQRRTARRTGTVPPGGGEPYARRALRRPVVQVVSRAQNEKCSWCNWRRGGRIGTEIPGCWAYLCAGAQRYARVDVVDHRGRPPAGSGDRGELIAAEINARPANSWRCFRG